MALGRTFNEALQKALRSLESDCAVWWRRAIPARAFRRGRTRAEALRCRTRCGLFAVKAACRAGMDHGEDPRASPRSTPGSWRTFGAIADFEKRLEAAAVPAPRAHAARVKALRFQRPPARDALGRNEEETWYACARRWAFTRSSRWSTPAPGEFEARTPYYYVVVRRRVRGLPTATASRRPSRKVVILGSGPNRIGQGIEFDYCCVHAAMALREMGVRVDHGQLQPGDGEHRFRRVGPAVLRAGCVRARDGHRRRRRNRSGSSSSSAGRRR